MKKHYTVKQVSEILNLSPITLRKMIRCGRINAFKIGPGPRRSPYLISEEELERLSQIGYDENMKNVREFLEIK